MKVRVTHTDEIEIDLKMCAKWFSGLTDEEQAQFIIEVAGEAKQWGTCKLWQQFNLVGDHLRTCECSNDDARELIEAIYHGIKQQIPKVTGVRG